MRLIDADALKEYIDAQKGRPFIGCTIGDALKMMVDEQPTIERKTGKWEQDNPFTKPRCSECGEPCFGLHGFDYTLTPYCPNCGADMRGGNER